jgi:hypothetical protein
LTVVHIVTQKCEQLLITLWTVTTDYGPAWQTRYGLIKDVVIQNWNLPVMTWTHCVTRVPDQQQVPNPYCQSYTPTGPVDINWPVGSDTFTQPVDLQVHQTGTLQVCITITAPGNYSVTIYGVNANGDRTILATVPAAGASSTLASVGGNVAGLWFLANAVATPVGPSQNW